MKIYTKTGDRGDTGLFGGVRVDKDDARVEAYGSVDELNACVGVARAANPPAEIDGLLEHIQNDLFVLGAELATVPGHEAKLRLALVSPEDVQRLEQAIDHFETTLAPLKHFVLPAGSPSAASLHLARTVCRRAERRVRAAARTTTIRDAVQIYLNRLSDLLFVLARSANLAASVDDVPWKPTERG